MIQFNAVTAAPGADKVCGWVDNVGFAMIENITFSVGSHDVETLTGEHLNIMNELMRSDSHRYGYHHTLKTGAPLTVGEIGYAGDAAALKYYVDGDTSTNSYGRVIAHGATGIKAGKTLTIPLGKSRKIWLKPTSYGIYFCM